MKRVIISTSLIIIGVLATLLLNDLTPSIFIIGGVVLLITGCEDPDEYDYIHDKDDWR